MVESAGGIVKNVGAAAPGKAMKGQVTFYPQQ